MLPNKQACLSSSNNEWNLVQFLQKGAGASVKFARASANIHCCAYSLYNTFSLIFSLHYNYHLEQFNLQKKSLGIPKYFPTLLASQIHSLIPTVLKVPQWEGVGVAKDSDIRGDFLTPAVIRLEPPQKAEKMTTVPESCCRMLSQRTSV